MIEKVGGHVLKLWCARRNDTNENQRLLAVVFELMLLPARNENHATRSQLDRVSVYQDHTVARVHKNLVLPVVLV